jgi:hypothetical protein
MCALRWPALAATLVCLIGCLGDPVGPGGTLVVRRISPLDSVLVGAPGRPLPTAITFEAVDGENRPVAGAAVIWTVAGANGRVDQAPGVTDARGQFSVVWVLGTRAADAQGLTAQVAAGNHKATVTVRAVAKPIEVASIAFATHDTTMVKLGVATRLTADATDPFGNHFVPAAMRFASLDTSLCTVDSLGNVQARKRGFGEVVVLAGPAADTAWVHPTQVVQAVVALPDTLRFHSLGQTASLTVHLMDDQGLSVKDSLPADSILGDTVAQIQPGPTYAVRSVANGMTNVIFRAGLVAQTVHVVVNQKVASVKLSAGHVTFDALGDTTQMTSVVSDSLGAPLANQVLAYSASDPSVAAVGSSGLVTSKGNGSSWVYARAMNGVADSVQIVVAQQVARLVAKRDSILLDALHAILPIQATAVDRLGSTVQGALLTYTTLSPSIATIDQSGNIQAIANGATLATATYGVDTVKVGVRVSQRPVRVLMSSDTIRFVALGETQAIQGIAVDSLGYAIASAVLGLHVADTTVVQQVDSVIVRSHANGSTVASFSVGGLPAVLTIEVNQVPTSITAALTYGKPILTLAVGSTVPLSCQVYDRNGFPVNILPTVSGAHGTVAGTQCGSLAVAASGIDTLSVATHGIQTHVPLVVAAAPSTSSTLGMFASFDSFPSVGTAPWAPTLLRNPSGALELYSTVYSSRPDSTGYTRGNLYRWTSTDGINYRFDQLVIPHADSICDPQGQGIENIAIVPRSDGPGWRMFYAAGSNACYGWEVFSAVSVDRMNWTKEPGIRLSNGNVGPKGPAPYPPYPVGEGMWPFQSASGDWRMIVGTQEHTQPPANVWQIALWTSPDQLNWTYSGTVLTTRQMPPQGQGAVGVPTIRQIAPSLWRMIFVADDRGAPTSYSAIWSAVSVDLVNWQIEGQLLGAPGTNLYYPSLVDGHLIFVRQDVGGPMAIATATVSMP